MFKKQSYEENVYMKIFNYLYIFLMLNVLFTVTNIPFFLTTLFLAIDVRNIFPFLLSTIPFGAGIIGIVGTIDYFYQNGNVQPISQYFKVTKHFWKKGLIYWGCCLSISVILIIDILFFVKTDVGKVVIPAFILLAFIVVSTCLTCFYFQVRNPKHSIVDVAKLSFFIALKKWYISILNVVLFIGLLSLMIIKPQFGYIVAPSIFGWLLYINCKNLYKDSQSQI